MTVLTHFLWHCRRVYTRFIADQNYQCLHHLPSMLANSDFVVCHNNDGTCQSYIYVVMHDLPIYYITMLSSAKQLNLISMMNCAYCIATEWRQSKI